MKEHHASLESEKQKSELTQVLAPANDNSVWKFSLLIKKKNGKGYIGFGSREKDEFTLASLYILQESLKCVLI